MKAVPFCIVLAFLIGGCGKAISPPQTDPAPKPMNAYPTVRVDLEHLATQRKDGTESQSYEVQASEGIILDTTLHQPVLGPKFGGVVCNSVQVVLGNDRQYSAAYYPASKNHVLDRNTLRANPGSIPFSGTKTGDSCIIAIGNMREERGQAPAFSVAWVSLAKVK